MIKHLLRILWNQRRSNGWIFAELLVVAGVFWLMADRFYVDLRTYRSPLGFDIANVWRFKLSESEGLRADSLPGLSGPEKLTRLMTRIREWPEVEEVCATYYSCPYSRGNSWREIVPLDGDTSLTAGTHFQIRNVTPEYFRLFRIRTPEGRPVADEIAGQRAALVLSEGMAELLYHGRPARGREVRHSQMARTFTVASVSTAIRASEYEAPEPCFFQCLEGELFNETVDRHGARNAELCVRMKRRYTRDDMNRFLNEMGDRLAVDGLFVYGISDIRDFRDHLLEGKRREMSRTSALMAFMLANVFFGVIGTFWLRARNRRGEIGLRMALGASAAATRRHLYLEGLCLLALTLPWVALLAVNVAAADLLDTYRLPLTAGRLAIAFGATYATLGGMICLGIWLPVRAAARMSPAEALRYE
ncbi:ABC transporter permease [Parabacteroides sp. ZJ-118]|uniref:ABC transporter permease n=1 Tax=Parabacteroides sp. ZJ-118 TaxID=2709398 RepID=UPI0013EB1A76|nr:FtsX-like permease family protein [Parabacteroides sp. ZJ-118]